MRSFGTTYIGALPVILILLGFFLAGCNGSTPVIGEPKVVDPPTPVAPGAEVSVSIDVTSSKPVSYQWKIDEGDGKIIKGETSSAVVWQAPQKPGLYNVYLQVTIDNVVTEKSIAIKVASEADTTIAASTPPPTETPATSVTSTATVADIFPTQTATVPPASPTPLLLPPTPTVTITLVPTNTSTPILSPTPITSFVQLYSVTFNPLGCQPNSVPAGLIVFYQGVGRWASTEEAYAAVGDSSATITIDGQPATFRERSEAQWHSGPAGYDPGWGFNTSAESNLEPGVYEVIAEWRARGGNWVDKCTLTVYAPGQSDPSVPAPTNTLSSALSPVSAPRYVLLSSNGICQPRSVSADELIVFFMGVSGGGLWTTPEQAYEAIGDSYPVFTANGQPASPVSEGLNPLSGMPLNDQGRSEARFHGEFNQWGFEGFGQIILEPGEYEVVGEWKGAPFAEWVYKCILTVVD